MLLPVGFTDEGSGELTIKKVVGGIAERTSRGARTLGEAVDDATEHITGPSAGTTLAGVPMLSGWGDS